MIFMVSRTKESVKSSVKPYVPWFLRFQWAVFQPGNTTIWILVKIV